MHRDRLARFAIDLLEFIFKQKGVKLVVHRKNHEGGESTQQLAEDLMAIITVFVASHHGKRAAEGKDAKGKAKKKRKMERSNAKKDCNLPQAHKIRLYPKVAEMNTLYLRYFCRRQ